MPGRGEEVRIYTYFSVREDAMQLFGFLSEDDLEMYRLLLGVNGVGPKAALGVLSVLTADDLRFAVLSDDAKTIAKAPGIGNKTAQKMILELKDKLSLEDAFEKKLAASAISGEKMVITDARDEAVQALTALGYSNSDALKAVRRAEITEEMDVETILKLALKQMAF
jgi:Holliday junction DNA helicase RuvA